MDTSNCKREIIEGLAKKAKSGNKESEKQLLEHQEVRGLILAVIQRRRVEHSREDAIQEIKTKLIQNLGNWHETASFSTWAWKVADSVCVDIIRKRAKQEKIQKEMRSEKFTYGKKSSTSPESKEGRASLAALRERNARKDIEGKERKEVIRKIIDEVVDLNDVEINLYVLTNKEWKEYFNCFLTIDIPISKFEAVISKKKSQIYGKAERGRKKFIRILKKHFPEEPGGEQWI